MAKGIAKILKRLWQKVRKRSWQKVWNGHFTSNVRFAGAAQHMDPASLKCWV